MNVILEHIKLFLFYFKIYIFYMNIEYMYFLTFERPFQIPISKDYSKYSLLMILILIYI